MNYANSFADLSEDFRLLNKAYIKTLSLLKLRNKQIKELRKKLKEKEWN